jgi:hypothetical protein
LLVLMETMVGIGKEEELIVNSPNWETEKVKEIEREKRRARVKET